MKDMLPKKSMKEMSWCSYSIMAKRQRVCNFAEICKKVVNIVHFFRKYVQYLLGVAKFDTTREPDTTRHEISRL